MLTLGGSRGDIVGGYGPSDPPSLDSEGVVVGDHFSGIHFLSSPFTVQLVHVARSLSRLLR